MVDAGHIPVLGHMKVVDQQMPQHYCLLSGIGTTIWSDMWAAYDGVPTLPGVSGGHKTVNHSIQFFTPRSGAHTNAIEAY